MKRLASHIFPVLAPALLIGGCAGTVDNGGPFYVSGPLGGQVNVSPVSVMEQRFSSVVRQQYDFSCGSAALATLLSYHYDMPLGEEAVFLGMWQDGDREQIRRLGFSLLDMKRYLAAQGIDANGYSVNLEDIEAAETPGIALISTDGYRHFVVIKGIVGSDVLLGDPSLGLRRMDRATFEEAWTGVYFVVTDGIQDEAPNFNLTSQWSKLATPALNSPFLEPVSQQALNLTAPFYRDF